MQARANASEKFPIPPLVRLQVHAVQFRSGRLRLELVSRFQGSSWVLLMERYTSSLHTSQCSLAATFRRQRTIEFRTRDLSAPVAHCPDADFRSAWPATSWDGGQRLYMARSSGIVLDQESKPLSSCSVLKSLELEDYLRTETQQPHHASGFSLKFIYRPWKHHSVNSPFTARYAGHEQVVASCLPHQGEKPRRRSSRPRTSLFDALEEWRKIRNIEKFTVLGHSRHGAITTTLTKHIRPSSIFQKPACVVRQKWN